MSGPARYTALGRKGFPRTPTEPIMPDGMVSRCRSWLDALDKTIARERQERAHAGPVGAAWRAGISDTQVIPTTWASATRQ